MVMIPIMLSVFTRPCTVMIETKDAARTAQFVAAGGQQLETSRASRVRGFPRVVLPGG